MKCDIIIPVWNQLDYTTKCIKNIIKNTSYPYRLILIDNASDAETRRYLEGLADPKRVPHKIDATIIRNEKNLGFVKAVNQGLKISDAPYVCVMNNDTIPGPGWLETMIEFGQTHADVGLMNPQCNGHQNTPIDVYAKMLKEKNSGKYMEMNQCQGFCMLIKREVIDKIGYLDESFGIGGFDDTDYSMRAFRAGYRCVSVHSSYVYHRQHVSFKAMGDRKVLVAEGERAYFKKWPRHLRIAVAFSVIAGTKDEELENLLETVLFLAREWCWVNLWILGEEGSVKSRVEAASRSIDMPLHQNIKLNVLPSRGGNIQVLIRLIERSFGTKRRKRYDSVLVDDRRLFSLLRGFRFIHGVPIHLVEFKKDILQDVGNLVIKLREAK